MSDKPNIVVLGMLDTKYVEIKFLRDQVEEAGGHPIVMEMSLGHETDWDWVDVGLQEVLDTVDIKKEEVFKWPRSSAIETVGNAGAKKILELYEEGKVDGVISWAGSVGTTTITYPMRALPFGVPKIMMTDMASSDVSMWLGNKDIYIMNPTAELGINVITRKQVANAAAGIVGMAKAGDGGAELAKPLMAITAYGTTTPPVNRMAAHFGEQGWDTITIHQTGAPGATMEDLIRSGDITALIDLTTGELTNNMYNSVYRNPKTWTGERCTAASAVGIPQIVCPGGLDQCAYGAPDTLAEEYKNDFKTGKRRPYKDTGFPYIHNEGVTIMWPTIEEIEELSDYFVEKLADTTGPTAFVIPLQGWSAYDQREGIATRDRGWSEGNGDGPQWEPDDEYPDWSKRAVVMARRMAGKINKDNPHLDFIAVDMHIMDVAFTDLLDKIMDDMLDGTWKKGAYTAYAAEV
ncbi:MAG: Tm-1-like ATP-binding domain-containing protein [Clostridiales Family XIII bacterium]|jgi:uncharacterized protein (UPF0261 family)|nr:Tm-1-like ATP-binding domain-containing protein [Clostridiales Family XIII bacterium]